MEYRLCPSILSADFNRLGEQIQTLEKAGVEWLHIDVTVQPGFGGQKYLPECTEKIVELKELIDREELDVDIQVDGGINDETMEIVMKAGANLLVAGSYVFSGDLETNVYSIQKKMDKIKSEID